MSEHGSEAPHASVTTDGESNYTYYNNFMLPPILPPAVATFIACCDEIIVDKSFPTLGTALIRGHLTLILGELYFQAPNDRIKIELLKHELGHFALGHISRCK